LSSVTPTRTTTLAIDGGKPLNDRPYSPWPSFTADEIEAATAVLRSGKINYWTGNEGREFEREYAAHVGCKHAIALANGTVALELALYALGIGPGDEVVTSSRTFIASASCAVMRGATPVCADVDRNSGNITAETIRAVLTPRTRAMIPVHLAGWPCDMDPILELAHERGVVVIEDCAQAHGATYNSRVVGSMGVVNAYSFCQDKIMTTGGEGGLLLTNDEEIRSRAWSFKDHGKSWDAVYNRTHPPGFRWVHESFGTNWRLTEMQSAMGRVLLRKLPEMVAARRRNALRITDRLRRIPCLRVPEPPPHVEPSYYKFYVYVRPELLQHGWTRDRVVEAINAEGVPCFTGSCSEIYLEKAFSNQLRPAGRHPVARNLGETSIMFMVHPTLTDAEIELTCEAVEKVAAVCAR
jgi:dTDP-4-amino-4,6-dideoxygalactose transaminase